MTTFKVSRPKEVPIENLTLVDLRNLNTKEQAALLKMIKLLSRQNKDLLATIEEQREVLNHKEDVEIITEPQIVAPTAQDDDASGKTNARTAGSIGKKSGKSSKYHYIYHDKYRNMYKADTQSGDIRLRMGKNKSETQLALIVDAFLDKYENDNPTVKKRPRNRDDFPEVNDLYLQQQQREDRNEIKW